MENYKIFEQHRTEKQLVKLLPKIAHKPNKCMWLVS